MSQPTSLPLDLDRERVDIAELLLLAVQAAEAQGKVISVYQVPKQPLRVGNYATAFEIRPVNVQPS